jgi:hypothetical protein
MKRVVSALFPIALGAVLLSAVRTRAPRSTADAGPAAVETEHGRHTNVASGTVARALAIVAPALTGPEDDREEIRRKVRDAEASTYIADILHERDSSLARWADRNGIPLTVWIQPHSNVPDFSPVYAQRVRQAFEAWDALGLPLRFAIVDDSADAEVHVDWVDRFTTPISGRTRWARDEDWVITDANITLAMHHQQGEMLDPESTRAMALHEIGHLLGLDHTRDTLSIMAPKVRVRQLSAADRATVRLLYALPTGPIR